MSFEEPTITLFQTLQNPITHRKLRFPIIRQQRNTPQPSLLEYTNTFLQQPLSTPPPPQQLSSSSPTNPITSSPTPKPLQLPRQSIIRKQADQDEALKQLKKRLEEQQHRNHIVLMGLRKYRPHNSSLTVGYRQLHEQQVRMVRGKNETSVNQKRRKKARRTNFSRFRNTPSGHQDSNEVLQQIFDTYETEKKTFQRLRSEEKQISVKMKRDYGTIQTKCEGILGYGAAVPVTDPKEFRELRKDMYQLSAKCQAVARSPRKR